MRRPLTTVLILLAWLAAGPAVRAAEQERLVVRTAEGDIPLAIELAATPEARSQGLMHRPSIPDDFGMLFDFQHERPVAMWMRNTLIPLDMLFIDGTGTIVRIAARTRPLSEEVIESGGPVRAVLEIRGGGAEALGIAVGDQVLHPIFDAGDGPPNRSAPDTPG